MTFGRLFNPIAVGRAVFTPSRPDRVHDPVVKRVQVVRTIAGPAAITWLLLALGVFSLWVIPFGLYGIVQALVHVFRTADLHETVPPLLATLLVWEVALFDLFRGAYDRVPLGVRVAFILGAPLSVTAVMMWELRRLRTRHGITLRGALLR